MSRRSVATMQKEKPEGVTEEAHDQTEDTESGGAPEEPDN
jgi:hypothetical protein